MPSRRLALIFVLIMIPLAIKVIVKDEDNYILPLIFSLAGLISCYTVGSKIDYWWHKRFPMNLDKKGAEIVSKFPFYQLLSDNQKLRFRQRVAVFVHNKEFTPMGLEFMPDDLKIIIAANAVILSLNQDDYLLEPFDRIYLYQDKFPSPNHPKTWHQSELETTDGTLLFSIPPIIHSQFDLKNFNPLLYEWSKAWLHIYQQWPDYQDIEPGILSVISQIPQSVVEDTIGLEIDWRAVAIHHFFRYPKRYAQKHLESYNWMKSTFL